MGSCSSPYFLEFNEFTGGWKNSESAEFSFISDQNPKNIFLILRHSNSYEYANIFLITLAASSSGRVNLNTPLVDLPTAVLYPVIIYAFITFKFLVLSY